jgi:hypothetical protein
LCTKLGVFLRDIGLLDAAATLQKRALDIDHTLFNNMSRRVAESTTRLAKTQHELGKAVEAVQNLYLAFGIYKQLTKPEVRAEAAACTSLLPCARLPHQYVWTLLVFLGSPESHALKQSTFRSI